MLIDIRVLELLSSKLCHDLVSPVSAINNGVELIEDIGGDVIGEAVKLIGNSGKKAARSLKLYRFSFGRAGGEANLSARDVRPIVEQYFEGSKISVHWPDDVPDEKFIEHRGGLKILTNAVLLSEETLVYGGTIEIKSFSEENSFGVRLELSGRNAQLDDSFIQALEGNVSIEDITPRTIQSYWTGKCAKHYGISVTQHSPDADRLDLTLSITGV
jgi:histidine phosphotransferase ChpT